MLVAEAGLNPNINVSLGTNQRQFLAKQFVRLWMNSQLIYTFLLFEHWLG
jgi:hypothetical protein